ncbi:unnamed protein product, partial [Didymodactylos carnosus]
MAVLLCQSSWLLLILCAYVIGGTLNHTLGLALHELAHNLAFGHSRPMCNRLLGFFGNLPLGDSVKDTDIPSKLEIILFSTRIGKFIFLLIMPFLYLFRPMFTHRKPVHKLEVVNSIIITFLGLSLHPLAGHFIAEHFVFTEGYETYSYYGPLNWITYNVGYHNEHHDFPSIPGSRLPQVRQIAAEYYENLPHYT